MEDTLGRVQIRPAGPGDAEACRQMRRSAFLHVFSSYMDDALVDAGANAYTEEEFAQHLASMPTSVAAVGGDVVGFCTVRRRDDVEAELLWLYVSLDSLRKGIGSRLALHAEEQVLSHFPGVSRIVLVTGVPAYNQPFYERLGYRELGTEEVAYPTASAVMVKLGKDLASVQRPAA